MSDRPSFQRELERLEAIVRGLEDSDLDLDEAIALFQEGVERLKTARELLSATELTVQKVVRAADGTLGTADLDD